MSTYIVRKDTDNLNSEFAAYTQSIQEASSGINSAVLNFHGLSDSELGGNAGTSMKAYMKDVHVPLLQCVDALVSQLLTDYTCSYLAKYQEGGQGVYETKADNYGQYPAGKIGNASKTLSGIKDGDLKSASSDLKKAEGLIPADISFSFPSSGNVSRMLKGQASKALRLKESVLDIEAAGKALFANEDSTFECLRSSLEQTVAQCGKGDLSIESYVPGTFTAVATSTGLRDFCKEALAYQSENKEQAVAVTKKSSSNIKKLVQKETEAAAKKKKFWLAVGTVASIAVAVVGVAAVIATAGTAGPIVFAVSIFSAAKSGEDAAKRLLQYGQVATGDYQADKYEGMLSDYKDLKRAGKMSDSVMKLGEDSIAMNAADDRFHAWVAGEKTLNHARDLGYSFGGYLIDETFSIAKSHTSDETEKMKLDVASEITSSLYSEGTDRLKFAGAINDGGTGIAHAGVVSTVGKVTEVVADYEVSKYDDQLDALDAKKETLDNLQENFGNNWNTSTAVNW